MEVVINGYTGRTVGDSVQIHSEDGHLVYCRTMSDIETEDELAEFMNVFLNLK